jgi:hypothetical protein
LPTEADELYGAPVRTAAVVGEQMHVTIYRSETRREMVVELTSISVSFMSSSQAILGACNQPTHKPCRLFGSGQGLTEKRWRNLVDRLVMDRRFFVEDLACKGLYMKTHEMAGAVMLLHAL